MKFTSTSLNGCVWWTPEVRGDSRGFFYRGYCKKELREFGVNIGEIVQVNHSFSSKKGTFRGFHFQYGPFAEEKLITCVEGEVLDIVVDLRKASPTFLKYIMVKLSNENFATLLVPKGCAHGFLTLKENSRLLYMHTEYYNPANEGGVSVYDPRLKIELPGRITELSERDKRHPLINENFEGIEI